MQKQNEIRYKQKIKSYQVSLWSDQSLYVRTLNIFTKKENDSKESFLLRFEHAAVWCLLTLSIQQTISTLYGSTYLLTVSGFYVFTVTSHNKRSDNVTRKKIKT